MKLQEILRFELAYQLRRVSTWAFAAILLLFGFGIIRTLTSDIPLNAPSTIAFFVVGGGAIWLIMGGALAGDVAARDHETRMQSLVFTAPISKFEYLGGRFLAAFLINATILLMIPLGMFLSVSLPGIPAEARAPFRFAGYLTAFLYLGLVNAFVVTALQFSVATRSRKAITAYLASVVLFMFSHVGSSAIGSLAGSSSVQKLFDLIGLIGIVGTEIETWTPIEQKTRLLTLEGVFLANRLLWVGLAMLLLVFTYVRFRFEHKGEGVRRRLFSRAKHSAPDQPTVASPIAAVAVNRIAPVFSARVYVQQTAAIARASFASIAKSKAGLSIITLIALITALALPEAINYMDVPMFPHTDRVLQAITSSLGDVKSPWVIIPLLIIFFAGDLVWREREAGVSEIADAAPVTESALLIGKYLGLAAILASWMVIISAGAILGQALMDHRNFEWSRYVGTMLGLNLLQYLLFAMLVMVIQVVVNNKYVGHLLASIAFGLIAFASRLGIEHKLLIFGASPSWTYSDFRGYASSLEPWAWFNAYWTAWAIVLAVVAKVMWVRSRDVGVMERIDLALKRMNRRTWGAAMLAVALVAATGGFTFYNTNIRNTYHGSKGIMARSVDYEKKYGNYEHIPQPQITATKAAIDIYPEQRRAIIQGRYTLVNRSSARIDTIHVSTMPAVVTGPITFDRPVKDSLIDAELNYRIYTLQTPLEPGDSAELRFEIEKAPRGFTNEGNSDDVIPNGTYFKSIDWFPAIGYQFQRQLTNEIQRRREGLADRPRIPSLYDSTHSLERLDGSETSFEATVSTSANQTAIAPGLLKREWTEGDRRFFHYVTDVDIGPEYAVFSANYAVQKSKWNDVQIEHYFHPRDNKNAERYVSAVQAALEYYTSHFGPYPFSIVRFVERRGGGVGMHADASTMDYSEGAGRLNIRDTSRVLDLISMVVAHEVSHQWWGSQVRPAYVEGAGLLGESLANYSALKVTESRYGASQLDKLLRTWRMMYDEPRTRASTPLLQGVGQFDNYRKGPLALYTLSQYIGEAPINAALRRMVERFGTAKPPLPISLDLFAELKAVTPDSLHGLLNDLFAKNTFWDLEMEEVASAPVANGEYEVTLKVKSKKTTVDANGVVATVAMDDLVEVAVYEADSAGAVNRTPIHLEKHRVHSGEQTITFTVKKRPFRAAIDPRYLLLGRATDENAKDFAPRKMVGI